MTRCRVGDLAVIVGGDAVENLGKIVKVVRPSEFSYSSGHHWHVEAEGGLLRFFSYAGDLRVDFAGGWDTWTDEADANLRPIRPQPDDAEDESLSWLPSPAWELADGIGT